MNQVDIGKYLAGKREEAKLSQKELAEKLCTREWKVSRWEKGKTLPNDFELLKLCEIFGITRIEILMGKDLSENEKHENSEKLIQHFWRIRGEHRLSVIIELLFWAMMVSWLLLSLWVERDMTSFSIIFIGVMAGASARSLVWIPKTPEMENMKDINDSVRSKSSGKWSIIALVVIYIIGTAVLFGIPLVKQAKAEKFVESQKYIYKGKSIQQLIDFDYPSKYKEVKFSGAIDTEYEGENPKHTIILTDKNDEPGYYISLVSYKSKSVGNSEITDTSSIVSVESDSVIERMSLDGYEKKNGNEIYYTSEYWDSEALWSAQEDMTPGLEPKPIEKYERLLSSYIKYGDYIIEIRANGDYETKKETKKTENELHQIAESVQFK